MSQKLSEVKPGTILISNHQTGPSYCTVESYSQERFGDVLHCDQDGERIGVSHVGDESMLGIGWKIPTEREIQRMVLYHQ